MNYVRALMLFCIVFTNHCYGQEPVWQQYTSQAGLPSNMIYDIYRDSEGYLWFATDNGISRYDGMHFETFSTADGLPDNEIFFFKEDYQKRLWMSTFSGELCYFKDGVCHTAANKPFLKLPKQTYDTKFITVHADSSVTLSFVHHTQYFVNIKGEKLNIIDIRTLVKQNANVNPNILFDITYISKPASGVYTVFGCGKKIQIDEHGKVLKTTSSNTIPPNVSYTQDSIYFFDERGIYDANLKTLYHFPDKKNDKIIRVYMKGGRPVLGTDNGLLLDEKLLLKGEKISAITQDINGNLWVGTLGHGVFQLKSNYKHYATSKAAYKGKVTYSYNTKEGLLFASSANKLYRISDNNTSSVKAIDSLPLREGLQYIDYTSFYAFDGDWLHKSIIYSGNKNRYKIGQGSVPKALIVNDSSVYVHLQNKILQADYVSETATYLPQRSDSRIFCMSMDAEGYVWYATKYLYKLSGLNSIHQPQFDAFSFKWFKFFSNVFVGITHAGKLVITKAGGHYKQRYTVLQDDCKWGIAYGIDSTHILFSTDGLYRLMTLQPSSDDTVNFSMSIVENEFIPGEAEYITADASNVYFFKQGTIYSLPIQELLVKPGKPRITNIVFKTKRRFYNTDTLIYLSHAEAEGIQIIIRCLSFDTRNLLYKYSISSSREENWNTTKNAEINLAVPGYGHYEVKIKAVTQSGIESEVYVLDVNVRKPFYLQWRFLALCFVALCLLVVLAVRLRIKVLLNKREAEYKLNMKVLKSEYKALNALMNPHFIFNSLNSIQGFVNKGNKELANLYLELFSKLIRQNMHNVAREVVTLHEEIELLNNYLLLEKMRFSGRFDYTIDVEETIEDLDILIPPLLIQPLAENAIKHGLLPRRVNDNKLWIRVMQRDGKLIIEVEDNGVGFMPNVTDAKDNHKSYALGNIHTRIAQLNELHHNVICMHIESDGQDMGTKITITVDAGLANNSPQDRY